MQQFDALVAVAERLLGPEGCPWDHKQTFESLKAYILEESQEVVEAVDSGVAKDMAEELGDLLYVILFYAKLGERDQRFSLADILDTVREKLVRRHPHVFGDVKAETLEEIEANWKRIKQEEKALNRGSSP